MRAYEYCHTVGFEETNLVGNVYYVNHIRWQGRCREMFLKEHAPDVLRQLSGNLRLVTLKCACSYIAELFAFDELVIRMRLGELAQNRLTLLFEYCRKNEYEFETVATGEQEIACMTFREGQLVPTYFPDSLLTALEGYRT